MRCSPRRILPSLLAAAAMALGASLPAVEPLAAQSSQRTIEVRPARSGETQRMTLSDGSALIGRVTQAGEPVEFTLSSGQVLLIERDRIVAIEPLLGEVRNGRVWEADPTPNRLFFGPTGRTIGRGKGYVASVEAIFATVGFGLHDRISVAGGVGLVGSSDLPVWLIPKLQLIDREAVDLSIGALMASVADEGFGILWSVLTLGPNDRAAHLGLGYGYYGDDLADEPMIMLGGEARVSQRVKLISENYILPDRARLVSFGPRFMGERLTADLGLGVAFDRYDSFVLPLVNFVWNW